MRKIALALAFLLCAVPSWAASTVVDTCAGQSNTTTSYTADNCTVSGANTYIACFVTLDTNLRTITGVTWDVAGANQALAAITSTAVNNSNVALGEWYGLANPTAGVNKSVTITLSGTGAATITHCAMLSGVLQASPATGGAVSAVDGESATVNVTSTTNSLVLAGLVVNQGSATSDATEGAGETILEGTDVTTRAQADENIKVTTFSEAGATTVTMNPSWTTSEDNGISAFSVNAAATARPIAPIIFQ